MFCANYFYRPIQDDLQHSGQRFSDIPHLRDTALEAVIYCLVYGVAMLKHYLYISSCYGGLTMVFNTHYFPFLYSSGTVSNRSRLSISNILCLSNIPAMASSVWKLFRLKADPQSSKIQLKESWHKIFELYKQNQCFSLILKDRSVWF